MPGGYGVEEILEASDLVRLPPEDAAGAVAGAHAVTVAFGAASARASLSGRRHSRSGYLGLSTGIVRRLRLPLGLRYCLRAEAGLLRLGPAIGVLAGRETRDLSRARLGEMSNHFVTELERGGAFYVLDREELRLGLERGEARGFLAGRGGAWEQRPLPLPQVIFRRYGVALDPACRLGLREAGVLVFNERTFHKAEASDWMARDPRLQAHLPETVRLRGQGSVERMLDRHGTVYIKPIWGSLGAQVIRVRRNVRAYVVEGLPGGSVTCADLAHLEGALRPHLPRSGIVQQGLDLASAGRRLVDFRVVLQKDGHGEWSVTGIVGRCGSEALHVSNMATGGFPMPAERALALLFGDSPATVFRRREELVALALAVGEALDQGGLLLGDLGLDVAYDRSGHPWLIEANNRDPDHNIGWEAGSWPLFHRFRSRPMDYARHLAGFGTQGGMPE